MEILEAYDLTGSYRAAAALVGCDHHTVRRYVQLRASGNPVPEQVVRPRMVDEYLEKIEEMVENSRGRIRADKVHDRLRAVGVMGAERTTRRGLGGVPTYALTDNEKTVTTEHIARIAVRNPQIVDVGRHYGLSIRTCVPADPQTKGGSEATVRIAKADLVPTEANLLGQYRSFGALELACRQFCDEVNTREHRETRRVPAEALSEEQQRLHPLPLQPFTAVFGQTRRVNWDATVSFAGVRYSVPHQLIDSRVWVRHQAEEVVVPRESPH